MDIKKTQNGNELLLKLTGSLDNNTSKFLQAELADALDGIVTLTFDFSDLEYISSAGLRLMLSTQKKMKNQGQMIVRGANQTVKDVFVITGFASAFTFEE